MKKYGFTLAEVLIALSLVGVIAAITLPSFTASTQNQANASKLSATVSTLENTFSAIIAGEGYDDFDEDGLYYHYEDPALLNRYIKGGHGENSGGGTAIYGSATPFRTIYGNDDNTNINSVPYYQLKSGAVVFGNLGEDDTSCGYAIDVNGSAEPNRFGRDVFFFTLNNNGTLVPYGANGGWKTTCSSNKGDGKTCTGRLIENNYKVDY